MKSTLVSRRKAFVQAAHAATVISVASGWSRTARGKVDLPPDPASDNQVLNALLAAEYDGVATYSVGAEVVQNEPNESVRETVLAVASHFQRQHREHARALVELIQETGGAPVSDPETAQIPDSFPSDPTTSDVLKLAADKEKQAAYTYVDVLNQLSTNSAAKLVAAIGGVESQHFIVLYLLAESLIAPTAATREMAELVVPAAFVTDPGISGVTNLEDFPALDEALALQPQ